MSRYEIEASFKGGDRIITEFRRMREEALKTSKTMQGIGRSHNREWGKASEGLRRSQDKIR